MASAQIWQLYNKTAAAAAATTATTTTTCNATTNPAQRKCTDAHETATDNATFNRRVAFHCTTTTTITTTTTQAQSHKGIVILNECELPKWWRPPKNVGYRSRCCLGIVSVASKSNFVVRQQEGDDDDDDDTDDDHRQMRDSDIAVASSTTKANQCEANIDDGRPALQCFCLFVSAWSDVVQLLWMTLAATTLSLVDGSSRQWYFHHHHHHQQSHHHHHHHHHHHGNIAYDVAAEAVAPISGSKRCPDDQMCMSVFTFMSSNRTVWWRLPITLPAALLAAILCRHAATSNEQCWHKRIETVPHLLAHSCRRKVINFVANPLRTLQRAIIDNGMEYNGITVLLDDDVHRCVDDEPNDIVNINIASRFSHDYWTWQHDSCHDIFTEERMAKKFTNVVEPTTFIVNRTKVNAKNNDDDDDPTILSTPTSTPTPTPIPTPTPTINCGSSNRTIVTMCSNRRKRQRKSSSLQQRNKADDNRIRAHPMSTSTLQYSTPVGHFYRRNIMADTVNWGKTIRMLLPIFIMLHMLPLFYAECDQTFVSHIGGPQNGTFSAPLLHNPKGHARQCLYTFLAGPGQRVEVVFTSFNLRGSPPDGSAVGELPSCVHEYMDIYSEVQSSDPAELIYSPFGGRYCGSIPPRRRISMYRAIAISFYSTKNVSTPELFEGHFRFINASEYEIGIPIAGSPCSYTITPSMSINKTGALISPTYPGAYPKDMSCTYQFLGESNQRVRLEFRDFDLFFGGPHCPFDYVKVYDGPDNSSALIGTYCGQQRNLVLYSSESSLFVHFYTLPRTANTQNRGFKGIYEFSESFVKLDFIRENDGIHIRGSECDQKILSKKESTGYVLSPNYPYPYIPKTVCRYFIYGMQDAQNLERVQLEFSAFNIPKVEHKDKSESNCTDGYLKIYLKGQETADAYDKFDYELCGNETQRVVSDGPRLAMVFSSGELQGRGFKGKYIFETEYKIPGTAAPDGTCSFTYVSTSKKRGELNSPRYPSNYPSSTNCSYLFLAEPNEQVTIVFDHFKVKADGKTNATAGAYGSAACFEDWLEIYVVYRDNNDRFLGRYCGLTAPGPVESPRGAVGLRITLHTDHENVASGFKARYFFETSKSDVGDCGGNFSNEDSGIITSPNYPAPYKAPGKGMASMACNWLMTARAGYKLSINFEHFSIEGDPALRGCPAAVLRLWVNIDSDQPPLELCGEKPPIEQWHYISTGQTARISFTTSDKTVGAQGFRIVWTEIQDSGPGPPSIGLLCESTYHFQCEIGYCISDKLRCDGVKNCGPGDDSDELHCITEAPEEDHGVLIIITLVVVSFLICLLCTLYHSRRKRRHHPRQLGGLHRNASQYDSTNSATVFRILSDR